MEVTTTQKPPVLAMWICMILGWIALVAPVLFTVFLGVPLAIAAFVLAIKCLRRGRKFQGILGCIGSTVGSTIAYIIGLTIVGVMVAAEYHDEYTKSAAQAETEVAAATSVPSVSAATVLADFAADRKAAESKYDGVFDVTGVVSKTGTDAMKYRYLSLTSGTDGKATVDCVFTSDKNFDLSKFSVGDEVTIRGKIDWFMTVRMLGSRVMRHE